jgi:hypothetical protein
MWIPAEPTTRVSRIAVVALGLSIGLCVDNTFGGAARGPVPSVIRSVRAEAGKDGSTTVVIEGTGPLPEPSGGVAATPPPRIYLDFTDVLPDLNLQPVSPTALVKAVRVAEHSASPLVTRVVINLVTATTYRVDSSGQGQGRIAVVLAASPSQRATGAAQSPATTKPSAPAASASSTRERPAGPTPSAPAQAPPRAVQLPPSTPVPAPPNAAAPSSAQSATARGRSDAAESQYGIRIAPALVRLHALRPLLEAIDRRADLAPGDLDAPAVEFDAVGKLLGGIKPPSSREGTHALLLRTCTLGARAVRMRQEASAAKDAAKGWDAASAAAGALMMFDRANGDLAK